VHHQDRPELDYSSRSYTEEASERLPTLHNARSNPDQRAHLHLIIPATSSNHHLCRLLLSVTALDYPIPVFINWGDEEDPNPYVQHVAKVGGILRYLNKLDHQYDDDLALIVDGYDVLFQLRPDVLIKRYYNVIDAANKRLVDRVGYDTAVKHNLYQSAIFGPDKICWPEELRRPAAWAVPDSTLPRYAFGPSTDNGRWHDYNRPRWLSSGTILGPLADVRRLLSATQAEIQRNGTVVSDQWHMQNIWAKQEYARTLLVDGPMVNTSRRVWISEDSSDGYAGAGHFENIEVEIPELDPSQDHEYHITVDYESQLFQTVAY